MYRDASGWTIIIRGDAQKHFINIDGSLSGTTVGTFLILNGIVIATRTTNFGFFYSYTNDDALDTLNSYLGFPEPACLFIRDKTIGHGKDARGRHESGQ